MTSYATLTKSGGRTINEDSIGVFESARGMLFVLADGLGGHGQGEVASGMAVKVAGEVFKKQGAADTLLEGCILAAQDALRAEQERQNRAKDMKTTVTLLHLSGTTGRMAHVGDSRIYTFRGDEVESRTRDHSVPQMLVLSGEIEEKDIRFHEDRNRLTRVLGMEWDRPKYDLSEPFPVVAPMSFLLCSDGFWELIDEDGMSNLLRRSDTPEQWLAAMEQVVLENGIAKKMDNYSAIAVFVR